MNKTFYVATHLILSIVVVRVAGLCETGWKSYGSNCYKFVPEAGLNQPDALVACRKMGGASLASVHSVDEHNFIMDNIENNSSYWIGLILVRKSAQDNTLVGCFWVDGSAYDYGACEHGNGKVPWRADDQNGGEFNEPNNQNSDENCVAVEKMRLGVGWNDLNCDRISADNKVSNGFICKKPLGNTNGPSKSKPAVRINVNVQL